jgi:DNA-binding NtrC family response regulator
MGMQSKVKQLLVIDDSQAFQERVRWAAHKAGWGVLATDQLGEVETWLAQNQPDVILLDWQLKDRPKFASINSGKGLSARTLLLSSGEMDDPRAKFIEEYGLAGPRLKPLDLERLTEAVALPPGQEDLPTLEELATSCDRQSISWIKISARSGAATGPPICLSPPDSG